MIPSNGWYHRGLGRCAAQGEASERHGGLCLPWVPWEGTFFFWRVKTIHWCLGVGNGWKIARFDDRRIIWFDSFWIWFCDLNRWTWGSVGRKMVHGDSEDTTGQPYDVFGPVWKWSLPQTLQFWGNDDQSSIVHKVPYWQTTPREFLVKDGLLTMEWIPSLWRSWYWMWLVLSTIFHIFNPTGSNYGMGWHHQIRPANYPPQISSVAMEDLPFSSLISPAN